MTTSPSAGDVDGYSPNTSRSRTLSSVQGVKQTTSTLKNQLKDLLENPLRLSTNNCYIGQILESLDNETANLLKQALDDKRVRHVDLVRLCEQEGYKMSEATMRRHRARHCRCPK